MHNEQSYYARMRSTMSDKLSALDGQVQKGMRVLDFGSGPSEDVYEYVRYFEANYYALDNSRQVQMLLEEKGIRCIDLAFLKSTDMKSAFTLPVLNILLSMTYSMVLKQKISLLWAYGQIGLHLEIQSPIKNTRYSINLIQCMNHSKSRCPASTFRYTIPNSSNTFATPSFAQVSAMISAYWRTSSFALPNATPIPAF